MDNYKSFNGRGGRDDLKLDTDGDEEFKSPQKKDEWNHRESHVRSGISMTPEGNILGQTQSSNQLLPPTFNLKGSFLKLSPTATMTGRPRKGVFFPKNRLESSKERSGKNTNTVYFEDFNNSDIDRQALMFR